MNYLKALLIILSTLSCIILDAMIPDDIKISPMSQENALLLYRSCKAAQQQTKKKLRVKDNTLSFLYKNLHDKVVTDIKFPSSIVSCCINGDKSRVATSHQDGTIHSFPISPNLSGEFTAQTIKSAEHPINHMCFGPDSTLVAVNTDEIICASFDQDPQHARFEVEDFNTFGSIVEIFPTTSPLEYVIVTEKETKKPQFLSLRLINK